MKIGLLGGSFDPLHLGHIHIAKIAMKKLGLHQVWLIPTAQNPLKKNASSSYVSRLESCQKLAKNHAKIKVKDFEKNSIFTYDLVKKITTSFPNHEFTWIMGADNLNRFYQWKNYKLLIKSISFAIISREDFIFKARNSKAFEIYEKFKIYGTNGKKLPKFSLIRAKNYDISSSEIRAKLESTKKV